MSPAAVALAGLAALAVAMGIGRFAFTPILPMMQARDALSLAEGGWLAAANYAGYLGGALSAPLLRSDTAIRGGLAAIALLTLAMGLGESIAAWLLLRALAGVASAWVLVHVSSWCTGKVGVVYSGVGAGSAVAGVVCLALMQLGLQWRHAWIALGAVSLAAAALLWPVFSNAETRPAGSRQGGWNAQSVRLVLCYSAFGFGYIVPATFIPAMAREALADPALFGLAWPLFGAAAAASTLAVAPLVRRLGNRGVWIAGHLVLAAGVAAPLLMTGLPGIVSAALCVGATFMVITMAGLQEGRRIGGGHTALPAAMTAGFAAGQIAGPVLVGFLADVQQASAAACFLLVASACALIPRRAAS